MRNPAFCLPRRNHTLSRGWPLRLFPLLIPLYATLGFLRGQLGDTTQYFPQYATGPNSTTSFTIHNPSNEDVAVKIEIYRSDGSPVSFQEVTLPSGATQTVRPQAAGLNLSGWAKLSSTARFSATELFRFTDSSGNLLTQAGVLSSVLADQFRLFAFTNPQSGIATGIAVANVSSTKDALMTVNLLSGRGELLATRQVLLRPLEHLARFLHEDPYFPELDSFEGAIVVK